MNRKKMLASAPCPAPREKSKELIAVTQLIDVNGRQILNLDFFLEGELKGRYFADNQEKSHVAYIFEGDQGWSYVRCDNVARLCLGLEADGGESYYWRSAREWRYSSDEDSEMADQYLGMDLFYWELEVAREKYRKAHDRKVERIKNMMEVVPCVPDEAHQWIRDEIFRENILFVQSKGDRDIYSCTACGQSSWKKAKKTRWKHNKQTVCPKCGQVVKVNKRQRERSKKECIIILQNLENEEWIERQFRAVCRWTAGEIKSVELYEDVRAIIPKGKTWGKLWRGTQYDADEFAQGWWDKNHLNKVFRQSYLWPGNLHEVLPCGCLERSGLDILAKKKVKLDVNKFIATFHARPYMEYLIKAGLYKLATDIIDFYGWWGEPGEINKGADCLKDALKLDGNRTNRLRQMNGSYWTLRWMQYEQKTGRKISQESLEFLNRHKVPPSECKNILDELGSVNRMVNYMKKQKASVKWVLDHWRDYLRMARDEGYDITDDIVRLPRDLKARHDALVETINARRDAERMEREKAKYAKLDRKIAKRVPEAAIYYWQDPNYMIVPAAKCEELMKEGRKLHHCVGGGTGYMENMADGKSWICFLRRKSDIEKPWYTLEIDMKTDAILQYYTEFNRKTGKKEVDKVLKKFKAHVKAQRVKQNHSSEEIMAIA